MNNLQSVSESGFNGRTSFTGYGKTVITGLILSFLGMFPVCSSATGFLYEGNMEELIEKNGDRAIKQCAEKHDHNSCSIAAHTFYYKYRNYNKAIPLFNELCDKHDKHACFLLGAHYSERNNNTEAGRYFTKACHLNNPAGCSAAADILGKTQNSSSLADVQKKLCDEGSIKDCQKLGIYLAGTGKKDQAMRLFEKTCQLNQQEYCIEAVSFFEEKKDRIYTDKMYQLSCNRDVTYGCYKLMQENIARKNEPETQKYAVKACNTGTTEACIYLAEYYFEKHNNPNKAKGYALKGCELKSGKSCNIAGRILTDQGMDQHSRQYFIKACNLDDFESCGAVAEISIKNKNYNDVEKYARKACIEKNALSCYTMGLKYEAQHQPEKAHKNFIRACNLGENRACAKTNNML